MHLDEEQIQRLLENDRASLSGGHGQAHLQSCAECRARLAEAEREESWLFERLHLLDHPVPPVSLRDVIGRSRRRLPAWVRVAAGVVLAVVTAGAAYAFPGSPVPHWVERMAGLLAGHRGVSAAARPILPTASEAGIAVSPGAHFIIEIAPDQRPDSAIISLSDAAELAVRVRGGSTAFSSDVGRLRVTHTGAPGTLQIEVPRTAPSVDLRVGAHSVWHKVGARIQSLGSAAPDGRYHLGLEANASSDRR